MVVSGPDTSKSAVNALAKAYASELEHHGISKARFIQFLHGLDQDLSDGHHGMLDRIVSMLESQDLDESGSFSSATPSSLTHSSVETYIEDFNRSTFHPVSLHVEIMGMNGLKRSLGQDGSQAMVDSQRDVEIAKVNSELARRMLKLENKLLARIEDGEPEKGMSKFAKKRDKAERKAESKILKLQRKAKGETEKAERKFPRAHDLQLDGARWVVITQWSAA